MINITLITAAGVMALFGWGWVGKILRFPAKQADTAKVEQRLQAEGSLKADGTISVDKEFDAELNAQLKEMASFEAELEAQMKAFEKQQ